MEEFTKYQRNVWHAEAVEEVAKSIDYDLKSCENDITYYQNNINDRIKEIKEQGREDEEQYIAEDWGIISAKKSIEQIKARKSLWEALLKTVDKELSF